MSVLKRDATAFREAQERQVAEARQYAAFFLVSGIDLSAAPQTSGEERAAILIRLSRLIERERLKGARKHWSYDLNRHIALKQVFERLNPRSRPVNDMLPRPAGTIRRRRAKTKTAP